MRVVCPYTRVHPLCEQALARYAPNADMIDLGSRHDAYHTLISELWAEGDFLLVEHDIEIHATVIPDLEECPEPWCLFEYYVADTLLSGSLGCTRFRAELTSQVPGFMSDLPTRDWRRLDCEITPRLNQLGFVQHVHKPPVLHHHRRENGLCDCKGEHP